jgi:hypothetical protein
VVTEFGFQTGRISERKTGSTNEAVTGRFHQVRSPKKFGLKVANVVERFKDTAVIEQSFGKMGKRPLPSVTHRGDDEAWENGDRKETKTIMGLARTHLKNLTPANFTIMFDIEAHMHRETKIKF